MLVSFEAAISELIPLLWQVTSKIVLIRTVRSMNGNDAAVKLLIIMHVPASVWGSKSNFCWTLVKQNMISIICCFLYYLVRKRDFNKIYIKFKFFCYNFIVINLKTELVWFGQFKNNLYFGSLYDHWCVLY